MIEGQVDTIDGLHARNLALKDDAPLDGKANRDARRSEDWLAHTDSPPLA